MGSPPFAGGSSELPPTRREEPLTLGGTVAPTRREQDALVSAPPNMDSAHQPGTVLLRLPDELAAYRVVAPMPGGNEADLVRVRGPEDFVDQVVKIYRWGVRVDEDAARILAGLPREHLVVPIRSGVSDGRWWELLEHVSGGDLADLVEPGGSASADVVEQVVRQLADALRVLHQAGIVHGDLKPANVLLRAGRPVRLAVADFGLSKYLGDASMRFTGRAFTFAYAAPESFAGRFSPAGDWWAVGMMVRHLLTGAVPFAGLDERVIVHELAVREVGLESVADARMRLLCEGLLVRDPDKRWGAGQVRRWLAGESPPTSRGATVGAPRSIVIAGQICWTRADAATALAADWNRAENVFLRKLGTSADPGEGWRLLRSWLAQFDSDVEERVRLIDGVLTDPAVPVAVRLLHLLRWLDRAQPPRYRGLVLLVPQLAAMATRAVAEPGGLDSGIVDDLWQHRLLPLLADFAGGAPLNSVDAAWRRLAERLAVVCARPDLPPAAGAALAGHAVTHHAMLLLAASEAEDVDGDADSGGGGVAVGWGDAAAKARSGVTERPAWFDALAPLQDPVIALVVLALTPVADAESRQRAAAREQQRRIWRQEKRRNAAARPKALGYALAAAGIWAGVTVLLGALPTVVWTGASGNPLIPAAVLGATWSIASASEIATAAVLGGEYHPRSSALTVLRRLVRLAPDMWDVVRTTRLRRFGCLTVPIALSLCCLGLDSGAYVERAVDFLLPAAILGWVALLVVPAPAAVVWSIVRVARFLLTQGRRRRRLTGEDGFMASSGQV